MPNTDETKKANETAGGWEWTSKKQNMENKRVRNRRYKIKRILAQPKNIEVKQYGRLVRRMVTRRSTIYPGSRRRNYY